MRNGLKGIALGVAMAALLSACGATQATPAASATAPGGGGASAGPSASASSAPSAPSSAAASAASTAPGSASAAAGYPADPCTLLTLDQVDSVTALGAEAGDSGGDIHLCAWVAKNGQVQASDNEGAGHCDAASSPAAGITVTPVPGLGDQACILAMSGLGTNLVVYRKGLGFRVNVTGSIPDGSVPAMEEALAKDLLANLHL
jgi:hypothetical protein